MRHITLVGPDQAKVQKLAYLFAAQLEQDLTPNELATARALNEQEKNPSICHSHDVCDANEVMAVCFQCLMGREFVGLDTPDEDLSLVNKAWDLAKAHGLSSVKLLEAFPLVGVIE